MNQKLQNFTVCGKLGDFTHMFFAIKHICEKNNTKANIYVYHVGWEMGIDIAFKELQDIVLNQPCVYSFNKLENYKLLNEHSSGPIEVYDKKLIDEGYIHVEDFMRSPLLYKTCWSEIFSNMYQFSLTNPYPWIKFDMVNDKFTDKVVINRRFSSSRINPEFPYQQLIDYYRGNIIFIATSENDYEHFPWKSDCEFYKITDVNDWFTVINSCALYIGNLSGPSSIASSLDKKRIIELPQTADIYHWMGEEKYSSNIGWFVNNNLNYINFN